MKDITVLREAWNSDRHHARLDERHVVDCIVADRGVLGLNAEILRYAQDDKRFEVVI